MRWAPAMIASQSACSGSESRLCRRSRTNSSSPSSGSFVVDREKVLGKKGFSVRHDPSPASTAARRPSWLSLTQAIRQVRPSRLECAQCHVAGQARRRIGHHGDRVDDVADTRTPGPHQPVAPQQFSVPLARQPLGHHQIQFARRHPRFEVLAEPDDQFQIHPGCDRWNSSRTSGSSRATRSSEAPSRINPVSRESEK